MKLKLVVASMSLLTLSLVGAPAEAAKHKVKHHKAKHVVMHEYDYKGDYKGMVQPVAVLETCVRNVFYESVIDAMHQNLGRAKPTVDCNKPLTLAGGINFDAQWGNRSMGYMGENVRRIAVNDAYLNVYGNVNEWTKAFASISFSNPSVMLDANKVLETPARPQLGKYSNVYNNSDNNLQSFNMEQGYITVGNLDVYPVFLTLGKQYQDYGRYQIHPMTRSMSQVMTETLTTSANIGFVTNFGLHGSAGVFDNNLKQINNQSTPVNGNMQSSTTPDFTVALGFDRPSDNMGFDVGLAYMYNMTGVNDVAYAVNKFRSSVATVPLTTENGFNSRVGAMALYGDVNSGPFSASLRYTTALQTFNIRDLSANVVTNNSSASPWSADLSAGYNFTAWYGRNNNLYLGYQASGDAVALFLPSSRWLVGYNVEVWKNTNLALEGNHDVAYSMSKGGTGNNSNTVTMRVGVKFG